MTIGVLGTAMVGSPMVSIKVVLQAHLRLRTAPCSHTAEFQ
jgi:hypothetical protein